MLAALFIGALFLLIAYFLAGGELGGYTLEDLIALTDTTPKSAEEEDADAAAAKIETSPPAGMDECKSQEGLKKYPEVVRHEYCSQFVQGFDGTVLKVDGPDERRPAGTPTPWKHGRKCLSWASGKWNDRGGGEKGSRCCPMAPEKHGFMPVPIGKSEETRNENGNLESVTLTLSHLYKGRLANHWAKAFCMYLPRGANCLVNSQCLSNECSPQKGRLREPSHSRCK